ncbi:F-box family protein [Tasmannia lanceolata]|uniref:F-box family protein n=1 Tax=Tasmannia lanceolata TaxID=3420 RepID=UPI004063A32E
MSIFPDEIWSRILEIGIESSKLSYRDLCCISISSRRLNRLSNDDTLWSSLLTLDFPSLFLNPPKSPSKLIYKTRFQKDKAQKLAAHRRALLKVESEIYVHTKNLEELSFKSIRESEKMKETIVELTNLEKVRQASVALNVWQPEVIRGKQKQMVEQCAVPVEHRIRALEMELRVCENQIAVYKKAYKVQEQKLDASKERLASLKYHPLHDNQLGMNVDDSNMKRKKLKQCNDCSNPSSSTRRDADLNKRSL